MESTSAPDPITVDRAREICLLALERRMRSRKELADRLKKKGTTPEVAATVLDRLTEVGLINDEAYARAFVASRQRTKPRGARALAMELRQKGIADPIITAVLLELDEGEDTLAAAARAVAPKLRALQGKPPEEARRKAEQFLLRRGFNYEIARTVLDQALPRDAFQD